MKIGIHCKTFLSWGGGVDLLSYFISALSNRDTNKNNNNLILILPEKSLLKKIEFFFRQLKKNKKNSQKILTKESLDLFRSIDADIKILKYKNDKLMDLTKKIQKEGIDVICPTADSLGNDFIIPWIGYIFDLQHKYLPHFFNEKEKQDRDKNIRKILTESNAILVNSKAVKDDLKNFYKADITKIFVLPFAPFLRKKWLNQENHKVLKALPEKYFVISNQFWSHKSHITAFQALKKVSEMYNINDVHIVCTGNTYDYRQPEYFKNLLKEMERLCIREKIHFLGFIPKDEQIQIMRNSIGVIQPTLFEGGPGGGSVYDAVSLGVPAIVSDIPVNIEIEEPDVIFFKAGDSFDLAQKIYQIITSGRKVNDYQLLLQRGIERQKRFAEKILETINFALKI